MAVLTLPTTGLRDNVREATVVQSHLNFRFAKINRPIGLNKSFQRKRSIIKRIGRLISA